MLAFEEVAAMHTLGMCSVNTTKELNSCIGNLHFFVCRCNDWGKGWAIGVSGFDPRTFLCVLLEDAVIYVGDDRTKLVP